MRGDTQQKNEAMGKQKIENCHVTNSLKLELAPFGFEFHSEKKIYWKNTFKPPVKFPYICFNVYITSICH